MEFKLKDGWWDYFSSGFLAGVFVMILGLSQAFPENITMETFVSGVVTALGSVVIFIMGCRVKRKQ